MKKLQFNNLPPLLTLQLKRFSFSKFSGNLMHKFNHDVKFPCNIDLSKYTQSTTAKKSSDTKKQSSSKTPSENTTYHLYGVIVHSGASPDSGHYYSYIQSPTNLQWYKMDDTSVQKVHAYEVFSAKAYLLFYRQSSTAHTSSYHPAVSHNIPIQKHPTSTYQPQITFSN